MFEKYSRETESEKTLRGKLSSYVHRMWGSWMAYVLSVGKHRPDGSVVLPADKVKRWKKQIDTKYSDLSEDEKQSDKDEVDKILAIITAPEIKG